jgi:hypothetical protein
MIVYRIIDFFVAVIIFLISVSDLYKGSQMLFRNQHHLLFMANISFRLLRLLPSSISEERYERSMNVYMKRRKLYGLFAVIGGFWGVLLSILIILNS